MGRTWHRMSLCIAARIFALRGKGGLLLRATPRVVPKTYRLDGIITTQLHNSSFVVEDICHRHQ